MAMIENKLSAFILTHPAVKTIVFAFSVLLSGVLTSAFVFEISTETGLKWDEFYTKDTFWYIVVYLLFVGIYNYYIYQVDSSVELFMDKEYSRAYVFKACMPEFVEKCKEEITNGTGIEGVKRLNDFLNKM